MPGRIGRPVRPIANLTLHAMLAAALAALAASAAAAAGPTVSDEVFVRLPGSAGAEQIAVQSFEWGSAAEDEAEPVNSRYYDAWSVEVDGGDNGPQETGSLSVRMKSPWHACRVGTRYAEVALSDGGRTYRLGDVTVSRCGQGNSITFTYGKLG